MMLFWILLAVTGLGFIGYGVVTAVTAVQSKQWPVVNGRVTQSQLVVDQDSSKQWQARQIGYRFAYVYEVNGQPFTGSRVSFGSTAFLQKWVAAQVMGRYGVETAVVVYYKPNHPEVAVLEPGFKLSILLPNLVGILLILPVMWSV